jgi:hypothetical protein
VRLTISEDFLREILSALPENLRVRLTDFVSLTRKTYAEKIKNWRKTHTENVSPTYVSPTCKTYTENGEIGSKTAISSENSARLAGAKGGGGVSLKNNNVHNTSAEDNVERKDYLKEKNIKKRKEIFEKLYENFPRKKGKEKGLENLEKLARKNNLPETETLFASLEICKIDWENESREPDKIPYFSTWVNSKPWADDKQRIAARIAHKQALAERKASAPMQPAPQPETAKKPPSMEEMRQVLEAAKISKEKWDRMDAINKLGFCVDNNLWGGDVNDFFKKEELCG